MIITRKKVEEMLEESKAALRESKSVTASFKSLEIHDDAVKLVVEAIALEILEEGFTPAEACKLVGGWPSCEWMRD